MGIQVAANAGRDAEGPQLPTRGRRRPCATGMPAAALAAAAEAAVARSRSPTPPPGIRPASTADMEGSAVRGKSVVLEEEVTFAGPGLSSFIESQREALSRQRQLQAMQAPEREAVPSKAYVEKDSAISNGLHPKPSMPASAAGSPELWHAVHIGNEALVTRLIQQGQCNGRQKDASGHSVLWHAIAFGHIGIALLMLDSCPAGEPGGVDASEVHPRKGDTFLHLLCQCRPFTKETAGLFKRVAEAVPAALFSKANANGQSFLALAAASLNFWVLKHVALRYPEQMKVLICSTEADQGKPPLRQLLQSLPNPRQPGFPQSAKIPEHFAVASMLSPDSTGRVPFADIAFDVTTGPDTHSRFLAHRVVVGAQSPVLLKELETLPLVELPQEGIAAAVFKVDRRISKDVWRAVLQFFYTGMVHCPFMKDPAKLVELFRAAAIYKLPKALLDLAQAALFPLLPSSPGLALEVFSISAGASGEGVDVASLRLASTFVLLGHASTVFADLAPETVSGVLERLLATSEQAIFSAQQEP
ncbi:LOGL8 [Symbiodinium sp. CCMP2456]|nr:LOGL8 [Symbiodinium sp. CCMP2456]